MSAPLTLRERTLGAVAHKLSADPRTIGPDDWGLLREVGLDDEGCLEVAHIVGIFNHLTRLADGFGLRVDPATLAAAAGGPALSRRHALDGDSGAVQSIPREVTR
jgi:hypothetical protein